MGLVGLNWYRSDSCRFGTNQGLLQPPSDTAPVNLLR
jgi:hypothetical protein